MEVHAQKIQRYLDGQKTEMESFLKQLVSMESPSSDPSSQEPIFELLKNKLEKLNYTTWRKQGIQTGGFMTAKPKSRITHQPFQLLIGHCDTVWKKGTINEMPIEKSNGRMKGPGVFDMKSGLTQMVFALQTIEELRLPTSVMPFCLINSDEEIGSRESTATIRRLAKISDRAYVLEPPLGVEGRLKTARKGLGRFTINIKGKAAHAGLNPEEGVSAILELSHQIQQLFAFNDPKRGITVNVGMIDGGVSPNVVAPNSSAVADVRVTTMKDAEEITKKIHSLKPFNPKVLLEIVGDFGRFPMEKTPRNNELWKAAQEVGYQLGLQLQDGVAGGGSDANTTSLYTATLDGLGTSGDGAHALHEYVFLEKLLERTALLVMLLIHPQIK